MDKSEIRKDYFQDKYVIIAPKRAKRPLKIVKKEEEVASGCFFCPGHVDKEYIVAKIPQEGPKWDILTVLNKFPALTEDNSQAFGRQEVIIETSDHAKEIHELPLEHIENILQMYIDRYEALEKIEGIKYVLVFKNEGGKAGASVAHSHSQVIALPLVPPEIKSEYESYANYYLENGRCPYCDIIDKEKDSKRVIWEDDHFFVISPYASQFPYGAYFLPKRHFKTMSEMNISEKQSLAKALKKVLVKLDDVDVAYNFFFHNAVSNEDYHMHLKLEPRPNVWAGLELGTGIIINPIPPEDAAKFYRD